MGAKANPRGKLEMIFGEESFSEVRRTVGMEPVETGGILLGSRDDYVIKKFVYDPHGSRFSAGYDPDVEFINKVIKKEWGENQLALLGFVHSHPRGVRRLSGDWGNGFGDTGYLKKIFAAIPALNKFLVPIIYSTADGGPFQIFPYVAFRDKVEDYEEGSLIIRKLNDEDRNNLQAPGSVLPNVSPVNISHRAGPATESAGTVETYRTRDGKAYFTFRFIQVDNYYEADIVDMPSYGERPTALHITHRKLSPRGGYQADLSGLELPTNKDLMRRIAGSWAESTWNYIQNLR